jgi:hypothetical protein
MLELVIVIVRALALSPLRTSSIGFGEPGLRRAIAPQCLSVRLTSSGVPQSRHTASAASEM